MSGRERQDHYEVLGLSADAPEEVIKAAYRALAAKYHPDRNHGDPNAELNLKRVNAAFAVLGDPVKRKQYDDLTRSPSDVEQTEAISTPSRPDGNTPTREPADPTPPIEAGSPISRGFGWIVGFTLAGAAIAAMRGGCVTKHPTTDSPPLIGAADPPTAETVAAERADQQTWIEQPDYRLAFPGTPRPPKRSSQATQLGIATMTEIGMSRPSGAFYTFQQMDYPAGAILNEKGAIDGAIAGMKAESQETPKLLSDRRAMIGSCNGRDFSVKTATFVVRSLYCIRGSRAYMASYAISSSATADEVREATSFLTSFTISPGHALRTNQAQRGSPSASPTANKGSTSEL